MLTKKKNDERASTLITYRGLYSPHLDPHKKILSLDWDSLVKGLRTGNITSTDVLEAYIGKVNIYKHTTSTPTSKLKLNNRNSTVKMMKIIVIFNKYLCPVLEC